VELLTPADRAAQCSEPLPPPPTTSTHQPPPSHPSCVSLARQVAACHARWLQELPAGRTPSLSHASQWCGALSDEPEPEQPPTTTTTSRTAAELVFSELLPEVLAHVVGDGRSLCRCAAVARGWLGPARCEVLWLRTCALQCAGAPAAAEEQLERAAAEVAIRAGAAGSDCWDGAEYRAMYAERAPIVARLKALDAASGAAGQEQGHGAAVAVRAPLLLLLRGEARWTDRNGCAAVIFQDVDGSEAGRYSIGAAGELRLEGAQNAAPHHLESDELTGVLHITRAPLRVRLTGGGDQHWIQVLAPGARGTAVASLSLSHGGVAQASLWVRAAGSPVGRVSFPSLAHPV
jgi:hypothetical protein